MSASTPEVTNDGSRQQSSSHMLKTSQRGNPFCRDTHDLFATLMVSLDLSDRTRFFRTYPNSFTTDAAAANLASLRFSQSNRTTDPNDPSRIVTTTTTTTFSMTREISKGICQHFMDARLIENAADPASLAFKDRGIFQITPKGLHVLERFITKNGISADHLVKVFTTQPICMKLLHLERRPADDEIHVTRSIIDIVFRCFAGGKNPNYISDPLNALVLPTAARPFDENLSPPSAFDRSGGIELQDCAEKGKNGSLVVVKGIFDSVAAIDWLVDYTTCCCRDEAAELLAHFVRYNLITLYADRTKSGEKRASVVVGGPDGDRGEFVYGARVFYRFGDEGWKVAVKLEAPTPLPKALLDTGDGKRPSSESLDDEGSLGHDSAGRSFAGGTGLGGIFESQIGALEVFVDGASNSNVAWGKDQHSTATRLRAILDEPALRALFRDFLRASYCDENLGFWIEVADFRRRFSTTSSAVGGAASAPSPASTRKKGGPTTVMETHQQNLVAAALHIYNTYLAPLSPNELNIDHNLRADVVNYVTRCLAEAAAVASAETSSTTSQTGQDDPPEVPALRATQVQTLLRQYERIQDHIFRLLATDQVPRFVRTESFLRLMDPASQKGAIPAGKMSSDSGTRTETSVPKSTPTPSKRS